MRKSLAIGIVATGILAMAGLPSRAEDNDNPAALAKALSEASVSLDQGLKASEREGKPISGKYEIENGGLQLSVYTMKGDGFMEVAGQRRRIEITVLPLRDGKEQPAYFLVSFDDHPAEPESQGTFPGTAGDAAARFIEISGDRRIALTGKGRSFGRFVTAGRRLFGIASAN